MEIGKLIDNLLYSLELLLNNPGSSFFFAFGAGHFVGEHTIIEVVRRAGFSVEPVRPGDNLDMWAAGHGGTSGVYYFPDPLMNIF